MNDYRNNKIFIKYFPVSVLLLVIPYLPLKLVENYSNSFFPQSVIMGLTYLITFAVTAMIMLSTLYLYAFRKFQKTGHCVNVFDLLEISVLDTQILNNEGQRRVRYYFLGCNALLFAAYLYYLFKLSLSGKFNISFEGIGSAIHVGSVINIIYGVVLVKELSNFKLNVKESVELGPMPLLGPKIAWKNIIKKTFFFLLLIVVDLFLLNLFMNSTLENFSTLTLITGSMVMALIHILLIFYIGML